jgi:Protein of unknown function (DUF3568)
LTAAAVVVGLLQMKTKLLAVFAGVIIVATGCVSTVNERHTAGVPFIRDRVEGRYERPAEQVYEAAKQVIAFNGALTRESTLLSSTNSVHVLEGKVNQRTVWIRVEPVDAKVSSVIVQARTKAGGSDLGLVHELDKQIALRLK